MVAKFHMDTSLLVIGRMIVTMVKVKNHGKMEGSLTESMTKAE